MKGESSDFLKGGGRGVVDAMVDGTELGAKSLDVPSNRGAWGLLGYWDESKLSFDSFVPLYDKGTSWGFLILFTFFFMVPKSGKRISMLSVCRDKSLAHQDLWRPAPYIHVVLRFLSYYLYTSCQAMELYQVLSLNTQRLM